MAHARKQIRDGAVSVIGTLASIGKPAEASRIYNIKTLPQVLIYTTDETVEVDTIGSPHQQERTLDLNVEIYIENKKINDSTELDDLIDQAALEVEKAIEADKSLNGTVRSLYLDSTNIAFNREGDSQHGTAKLSYIVTYFTQSDAPDIIL